MTGSTVNRYTGELDDIQTVIHDQIDTTVEAQMPLGYLIPSAFSSVADMLALHGVEMERTTKPIEQVFETYRFAGTKTGQGTEGHVMLTLDPQPVKEKISDSRRIVLGTDEAAALATDSCAAGTAGARFARRVGIDELRILLRRRRRRTWRTRRIGSRRISLRTDRAQNDGRSTRSYVKNSKPS